MVQKTVFPKPFYFMVFNAVPERTQPEVVKNLFSDEPTSFKSYLENHRGFRYAGWDLKMSDSYKIDLNGIESSNRLKRVRVVNTGGLIIEGALVSDFLCWGDEEAKRIKQLGIIEFTYNGIVVLKRMLEDIDNPKVVQYIIGFSGLQKDRHYFTQGGHVAQSIAYSQYPFPGGYSDFQGTFEKIDLQKDAARLTYEIIEKIHRIFGVDAKDIPFITTNSMGESIVNIEEIKKIQ